MSYQSEQVIFSPEFDFAVYNGHSNLKKYSTFGWDIL